VRSLDRNECQKSETSLQCHTGSEICRKQTADIVDTEERDVRMVAVSVLDYDQRCVMEFRKNTAIDGARHPCAKDAAPCLMME